MAEKGIIKNTEAPLSISRKRPKYLLHTQTIPISIAMTQLDAVKIEKKNVYNVCLLNYYCYLCGKLRKKPAYATAWRLAGESERTPLLSFYKVAINE